MVQSLPLAHGDPLDGGSQRRHRQRGEGIQHAGDRRLVSKPFPPPCHSERRIRPEAGVDVLEAHAVREHTDHHVEPFLGGLVKDSLAAELDMLPQRGEEILLGQDVSQGS
jgi:hypothetical protein